MDISKEQTISQVVAGNYRRAKVFRKFDIDFCCKGGRTIEEACVENRIRPSRVLTALNAIGKKETPEDNCSSWSIDFLVDYIINSCHNKARKKLLEIKFYAEKVTEMHGQDHQELFDVYQEFLILKNIMITHMEDEERQLFPSIKELTTERGHPAEPDEAESADMIETMQDEHREVGDSIKMIRKISNNYGLLGDARTVYQALFGNLAVLEKDLRKCMHLENNILFPKVEHVIQAH